MVVMAPSDENECRQMLTTGFLHEGPAAVRYPRGNGPGARIETELKPLPIGRAEIRRHGSGIALLAFGAPLASAEAIAEELGATAVNMRFVKPLDEALVLQLARSHDALVTIEENAVQGGAGSAVTELLAAHGVQCPVLLLGLPDRFFEHASREELLAQAGLDAPGIKAAILQRWPDLASVRHVQAGDAA
jgi:1-deoxy-D-xylulose-5-phosphate synthase